MKDEFNGVPPNVRLRLAKSLEAGHLSLDSGKMTVHSVLGSGEHLQSSLVLLEKLREFKLEAPSAGAVLRTIEELRESPVRPELAWTGSYVHGLNARDTKQVFGDLISSASSKLLISTYAYFDGPSVFAALSQRMDEVSDLQVTLFLNVHRKRADSSDTSEILDRFAAKFWERDWPGVRKPAVYFDPRSLVDGAEKAVLHAKVVVADDLRTFVTSANLTGSAFEDNIELGVVLNDRTLAKSISLYLQALIDQETLTRLPS